MQVPILREGDRLIVPVQGPLADDDLIELRDRLLREVDTQRTRGVVLDVRGIDVLDSFSARTLWELAQMTRLCGAEIVLVGVPPEIASAAVRLGLSLWGVTTASDLDAGMLVVHTDEGPRNRLQRERSGNAPRRRTSGYLQD